MKRLIALLSGISLFLLLTLPALAAFESGEKYAFISDDEVIDDDLFIAAEEVVIDGIVNGDVFAAGAKVTVNGVINGDLYVAGAMVDISGTVTDDVIAIGSSITLDGAQIGDSLITAGEVLSLDSDTTLGGGLIYAGASMDMDAAVERGVLGASAVTRVSGSVGKNVIIAAAELSLHPDTQINGDLKYWADEALELDDGIVVGNIEFVETYQSEVEEEGAKFELMGQIGNEIWSYLAALLVGCVFIAFLPKYYHRVGKEAVSNPLMSVVYGLLVLFGMPFAGMLLIFTIIGLPLGLMVLAKYFIVLYLGKIFVAAVFTAALIKWGNWKTLKKSNEYLVFAGILLAYIVLRNIPYVGGIIEIIALLIAWGAMAMTTSETIKLLKKAKL
ncbi:MAG: hypothetical protein ACI9QC_000731 [Oceanicoccus sp.]|jgi:hypothetical protein